MSTEELEVLKAILTEIQKSNDKLDRVISLLKSVS